MISQSGSWDEKTYFVLVFSMTKAFQAYNMTQLSFYFCLILEGSRKQ